MGLSSTNIGENAKWIQDTFPKATRTSNQLPDEGEHSYLAAFPEFRDATDNQSNRLLNLIQSVYSHLGNAAGANVPMVSSLDVIDGFRELVQPLDGVYDAVSNQLQDARFGTSNDHARQEAEYKRRAELIAARKLPTSSAFAKPQDLFRRKPDNTTTPFQPILSTKPFATVPFADAVQADKSGHYAHPYHREINELEPFWVTDEITETASTDLSCPLTWVETPDQLSELLDHFKDCKEVAIDLEHHSYRTYLGVTCLIQISSRTRDFIIDPFPLQLELEALNELTCNPKIVKVLHGADSDVLWLQRDFGVYIVNLFDTGQAVRHLEFPKFGLAYLLDHFCGVKANKEYQKSDWRIRPIPLEMMEYARSDTHYLLYIYDRLRRMLADRSAEDLSSVANRSQAIAARTFTKPEVTQVVTQELVTRYSGTMRLSPTQFGCIHALNLLVDSVARTEDESNMYVLHPAHIVRLGAACPKTEDSVLQYIQQLDKSAPAFLTCYKKEIATVMERQLKNEDLDLKTIVPPPPPPQASPFPTMPSPSNQRAMFSQAGWVESSQHSWNAEESTWTAPAAANQSNISVFLHPQNEGMRSAPSSHICQPTEPSADRMAEAEAVHSMLENAKVGPSLADIYKLSAISRKTTKSVPSSPQPNPPTQHQNHRTTSVEQFLDEIQWNAK